MTGFAISAQSGALRTGFLREDANDQSDRVVAAAQARIPRAAGFYETYYGKLNFTLHSAAQNGLAAFCRELSALGVIDSEPSPLPEVIGVLSR